MTKNCKIQIEDISRKFLQQFNRINRLMNKQLSTKTSGLNKQYNWNKLGLPQGASLLLPE